MCPITTTRLTHPRPDFFLVFPPSAAWVRTAREAVRTALTAAHRDDLIDLALLLTSEVVTNAVNACRRSGCSAPISLHADWAPGGALHVLVHDGAPGVPSRRQPTSVEPGGRGLFLISACAEEWGVCRHGPGPGKAVWFTLVR